MKIASYNGNHINKQRSQDEDKTIQELQNG